MIWKDWPYWLKGGIVATLIPILVFVVNLVIDVLVPPKGETFLFFFLIVATPALPIFNAFFKSSIPYNITYIIFVVAILVMYFIVGSVIGWIVGKRKTKSRIR
jgi:VIT1/CCC1 family predicted Fe2+/Mn2+ transporter